MVQPETKEAVAIATPQKQSFFKFGVYVKGQVICESVFNADCYNPPVRHNINLRPLAPKIMSDFQYVLRQPDRRLNFGAAFGISGQDALYNLTDYKYAALELPDLDKDNNTEDCFSFSLKINDKFIIERNFRVGKFNPLAIDSVDIVEMTRYWVEEIQKYILKLDKKMMWEEYELVNSYNLTYQEARALSTDKRESMLRRLAPQTEAAKS